MDVKKSTAATPVPSFLQQRRAQTLKFLQHHECETKPSHVPQTEEHEWISQGSEKS